MNYQTKGQFMYPTSYLGITILALIMVSFFSCGEDYDYEKQYVIDDTSWKYGDTLNYNFEIQDTTNIYNLYLEVEHSSSYSYQNLYTKIYTKFPTGERIEEVLSLELSDKAGNWMGDCRNDDCRLLIPIQQNAFFNAPGAYEITLEQYMRKNPMPGIHKLGFKLEKTAHSR
jgi:gliding motility-associated lipoprotein GldH